MKKELPERIIGRFKSIFCRSLLLSVMYGKLLQSCISSLFLYTELYKILAEKNFGGFGKSMLIHQNFVQFSQLNTVERMQYDKTFAKIQSTIIHVE